MFGSLPFFVLCFEVQKKSAALLSGAVAKKRYQAVGFPCNRMLKLSSSRGIRIDISVLSVSWSFEDHSVIIQALRKGPIEHEASDTGGVPRWKSSCPDRLAEATYPGSEVAWTTTALQRLIYTYSQSTLLPSPEFYRMSSWRQYTSTCYNYVYL